MNEIYFQRTLFSGDPHANVNKCIFLKYKLYYFYIWDSSLENGPTIAQMELRQGSAEFMRFCEDLILTFSDCQKKPMIYDNQIV